LPTANETRIRHSSQRRRSTRCEACNSSTATAVQICRAYTSVARSSTAHTCSASSNAADNRALAIFNMLKELQGLLGCRD
jgi:hypothetical protein